MVWFEGMTLDPHHLQQWDRYQEGVVQARIRSLTRYFAGLMTLIIDQEAVANGEFVLEACSGIMPDGLIFNIPDDDEAPAPRNIQEAFPTSSERLDVFIAVPTERPAGGNVLLQSAQNGRPTRFRAQTVMLEDENSGSDERPVEVAATNFLLRFGTESIAEYTSLQIARIRRTAAGSFSLDESYIPTCTTVAASVRLTTIVRRILELLITKSTELADRRVRIMAQREISPADVMAIGLSATINQHIPVLNHHLTTAESHPEAVFISLLALAGELSVFTGAANHPRSFPTYAHSDLTGCFGAVDALLREMLGAATPSANYVDIPLEPQRENLFMARLSESVVDRAQLFLVARSDRLSEHLLVEDLPRMLRVAAPDAIDAVLRSYTRALPVEHTNRMPSGMPVDAQANYFQIQKHGRFWEAIEAAGALSIFIPSEFSDVTLQLIAVNRP